MFTFSCALIPSCNTGIVSTFSRRGSNDRKGGRGIICDGNQRSELGHLIENIFVEVSKETLNLNANKLSTTPLASLLTSSSRKKLRKLVTNEMMKREDRVPVPCIADSENINK